MRTTLLIPAPPTSRLGFILAHETLWMGVIPAEWDGDNQPVFYDSRVEAEAERVDASEMLADALEYARMEPEEGDDGPWVEAACCIPTAH